MNIPFFKDVKRKTVEDMQNRDDRLIKEFCKFLSQYLSAIGTTSIHCDLKYIMYTQQVQDIFNKKGWKIDFECKIFHCEVCDLVAHIRGVE